MILTDFLLARITEDERSVMPDALARPRIVIECEAKRRIVEECQTFSKVAAMREEQPLPQALTSAGIVTGLERAMRHLALPYADHPDYREEWRP